ncbi:MAG: cbb3-type cytochrome c oxidase N-terminal domain-containing protein [Ferruginibacter sp.]
MSLQNLIYKKIAVTSLFLLTGFTMLAQNAVAAKTVESGNNLLATLLIIIAIVLIFVIYGMGQVLIAISRQLLDKNKAGSKITPLSLLVILSILSLYVSAQDAVTGGAVKVIPNYGGLSANTFYFLTAVIATEIIAILFLFFSIRRIYREMLPQKAAAIAGESKLAALWVKLDKKLFTKAIPLERETDALLDHNYDGIQELNNALPPWWKYGFIITIGFALVYLLNFHVLGNGKNPTEEYLVEMDNAKIEKEAFEAKNKDRIDEANVPMAGAEGVKKGKEFYMANCVACHGQKGEGGAGPNLTDDYWLHKGSLNDIYNTIKKGYSDKGMQSWAIKFNPKEISELASFVTTLKGTNPPGGKAPQGDLYIGTSVTDSSTITKPGNDVTAK